jgi:hypothetical protein
MTDRTYQVVQVLTPGVTGAECVLKTHDGKWRIVTPGKIQVNRSPEDLHVECSKANYFTALQTVKAGAALTKSVILNAPNGVVPGTAYDIASNAVYHYPDVITVEMQVDPAATAATALAPEPQPETLVKKTPERAAVPLPAAPDKGPSEKTMSKALRK